MHGLVADVLFEEDVLLNDVAGDLVGVEHPMYPRDHEVDYTSTPPASHTCSTFDIC